MKLRLPPLPSTPLPGDFLYAIKHPGFVALTNNGGSRNEISKNLTPRLPPLLGEDLPPVLEGDGLTLPPVDADTKDPTTELRGTAIALIVPPGG